MAEGRTTPEGWWVPPSEDETDQAPTFAVIEPLPEAQPEALHTSPSPPAPPTKPAALPEPPPSTELAPSTAPPGSPQSPPEAPTSSAPVEMLPTASSPAVAAQPHDDVNRSLTWVGASNAATQAPTEWPGLTAWKSQTSSQQQGPSAGTALVNPGVGSEASSPAGSIPAPPFSLHGQSAQPTAASTSTGADPFASRAKTVLVLSILGIVLSLTCVGGLFAPVAWIMGNGVRSDARATGHAELRSNKVGRILAMTGTVLGVLVVLGFTAYWVTT